MNRRGFLKSLGLLTGAGAAELLIPNARVWSFPTNIVIARPAIFTSPINYAAVVYYDKRALDVLQRELSFRAALTLNSMMMQLANTPLSTS